MMKDVLCVVPKTCGVLITYWCRPPKPWQFWTAIWLKGGGAPRCNYSSENTRCNSCWRCCSEKEWAGKRCQGQTFPSHSQHSLVVTSCCCSRTVFVCPSPQSSANTGPWFFLLRLNQQLDTKLKCQWWKMFCVWCQNLWGFNLQFPSYT